VGADPAARAVGQGLGDDVAFFPFPSVAGGQYGWTPACVLAYVSLAMVPELAFCAIAERQRRWLASGATQGQGVDRQATVQAAPLRVNEAGLPVFPLWAAWKPMRIDVPAAMPGL
jgi:hypothetical protein